MIHTLKELATSLLDFSWLACPIQIETTVIARLIEVILISVCTGTLGAYISVQLIQKDIAFINQSITSIKEIDKAQIEQTNHRLEKMETKMDDRTDSINTQIAEMRGVLTTLDRGHATQQQRPIPGH